MRGTKSNPFENFRGNYYLGIDPGVNGGISLLGRELTSIKMPEGEDRLYKLLTNIKERYDPRLAVMEEIIPRPTKWVNKKTKVLESSILRSTCILYANYCVLKAMLYVSRIPYETYTPQKWQSYLGITSRLKTDSDSQWKNKLKRHALRLFPSSMINLYIADSVLMAECARRTIEGGKIVQERNNGE